MNDDPACQHGIPLHQDCFKCDETPGPRKPLFPIARDARKGKPSCGECHLQPGETCDICGAKESA